MIHHYHRLDSLYSVIKRYFMYAYMKIISIAVNPNRYIELFVFILRLFCYLKLPLIYLF